MLLKSKDTLQAVANACELSTAIISNVMGNEIANTINGSLISKSILSQIVSMRVLANFSKNTKAGV